ncbi:MAG: antibiotic biosynthesis monooxygenase, partial [Blastocatellia bacterium]|nr:antibiotic biosynthesis monooxygenase [Blastocatellia bacterium]
LEMHREAQEKGRTTVFADYRLRVAVVQRDYGMNNRAEVPPDSAKFHQ